MSRKGETTLRLRTCRTCGSPFMGGPRAWFCPSCRAERKLQAKREYQVRVRAGTNRQLGSMDLCVVCGGPYTVNGGGQHYCPACAPTACRAIDNRQSREWNAANVVAEVKNAKRAEERERVKHGI